MRRAYHHGLLIRACLCLEAAVGPKKGKLAKASESLQRRCRSLFEFADECLSQQGNLSLNKEDNLLFQSLVSVCKTIAVISGGPLSPSNEGDSLAWRETNGLSHLQNGRSRLESVSCIVSSYTSLPPASFLLLDCLVPLFAAFRMCATLLEKFGWGYRKRHTKASAGALAELAIAFRAVTSTLLFFVER